MADFDLKKLTEIGGIFKFGRGVLGKSAVLVGILLFAVVIAAFRLSSDIAIISIIGIATIVFLIWFFSVLNFSKKHPDLALLEGAEWTGWKRFEASAKGFLPPSQANEAIRPPELPALPPGDDEEQ